MERINAKTSSKIRGLGIIFVLRNYFLRNSAMSKIHPEWALKHRKPGTEVRFINGNYYLYEVSSKWDKAKKRTRKITGKIIGRIKPDGILIPSKRRQKKTIKIEKTVEELSGAICVKEYGLSHFILSYMIDIVRELKKHYPDYWKYIIAMAYCRLLKQSPINGMSLCFYHSYLSEEFNDIRFTEKNISIVLRDIGRDRQKAVEFMKWDIPRGEHILVDMTDLPSKSKNRAYAEVGYNNKSNFSGQINLLYIFGRKSLKPIFYRILPGNITGLTGLVTTIKESRIGGRCIIIMDKGFYSKTNTDFLNGKECRYICPIKRNSSLIKEESKAILLDKEEAGFFWYNGKVIWYTKIKHSKKSVYLYLNEEMRIKEEKDYLNRVSEKSKKYSLENFHKKKNQFGILALVTNLKRKNAEQIYTIYKSRNEIEVMFDGLKNVLEADKTYMQNKETLQGWMFVNHIALLAHHRLYRLLLEAEKLKRNSVKSLIYKLALINKIKINTQWVDAEVVKGTKKLLAEIGIPAT